jgi:hypothetical protein
MRNLLRILVLDWKGNLRSPIWHRRLMVNIFFALMMLYLVGNLFVLGYFLDEILMKIPMDGIDYKTFGSNYVVRRLDQFLLYYFFIDFIIRYFMQKLPAMFVQPYLHLPIRKGSLVHFMLVKSIWSPFNFIHFIIFIPFMVGMFNNLPFSEAIGWSTGFSLCVFAANYFLLFLKRTSDVDTRVYVGMLVGLASLFALDWHDLVDFKGFSSSVFNMLFLHPWTVVLPALLVAAFCYINFRYLKVNMYLSRISKSKESEVSYVGGGILSRFGLIGQLAELEFKFI